MSQDSAKLSPDDAFQDATKLSRDAAKLDRDAAELSQDSAKFRLDAAKLSQDAAKLDQDAAKFETLHRREWGTRRATEKQMEPSEAKMTTRCRDAAKLSQDSARFRQDAAKLSQDAFRQDAAKLRQAAKLDQDAATFAGAGARECVVCIHRFVEKRWMCFEFVSENVLSASIGLYKPMGVF